MNRHLPLLMTLALAACGGGGGGGSPMPTTASTTPTPTPTPTQTFPLNAVTATLDTGTDPASGGLSIKDPAVPGTVSVTFDPTTNQITSMTFHQNGADHELLGLDGITVAPQIMPKLTKEAISAAEQSLAPNTPAVLMEALNFSAFGVWATQFKTQPSGGPNDGVTAVGVFAHGSETPANAVPTMGTAQYTGDVAGYASMPKPAGDPHTNGTLNMALEGNDSIGVDFGKRQVTTSFTNMKAVSMDGIATQANLPNLGGTGPLTGNAYTTTLTTAAGGPAMTGSASGKLYGPQAQETAGTFTATGSGMTIVAGFGGKM